MQNLSNSSVNKDKTIFFCETEHLYWVKQSGIIIICH